MHGRRLDDDTSSFASRSLAYSTDNGGVNWKSRSHATDLTD